MIVPVYLSELVVGAWPLFGSLMFKRTHMVDWRKMQFRCCDHHRNQTIRNGLPRFQNWNPRFAAAGIVLDMQGETFVQIQGTKI
jgi:hypothetical protein